jgi:hypothetical protein
MSLIVRIFGRGWPSGRWRSGLRWRGGILGFDIPEPEPAIEGYFVENYIEEGYVS